MRSFARVRGVRLPYVGSGFSRTGDGRRLLRAAGDDVIELGLDRGAPFGLRVDAVLQVGQDRFELRQPIPKFLLKRWGVISSSPGLVSIAPATTHGGILASSR